MTILLLKATEEDYEALSELSNYLDSLHREHLPHLFQEPVGHVREREYLLELIERDDVGLFTAEEDEKLVSYVHILVKGVPEVSVFRPRRFGIIDSIIVAPGYQSQGIGTRLMRHAEAWAKERSATSVELNVYEFNQVAVAFYTSLGYDTLSRRWSKKLLV